MRTILVGGFAAYILERGKTESPSQYRTFKGIIESVRCGGIKVPMEFDTFGRLHFQDNGASTGRTVNLNGASEIPGKWDITENTVVLYGDYPQSLIATQIQKKETEGLLLSEALDLPFHKERSVRTMYRDHDRVAYHLIPQNVAIPWEELLARLEGPKEPEPGILDHMQGKAE